MSIEAFREKIDQIDKQVLALLNERMELAGKIGEAKRAEGGPVYVPAREEKLIQKLLDVNEGPMGETQVRSIFREIISAGISLQKKMLIGFCGPKATNTHQAAVKNFGSSLSYKAYSTIEEVFHAVGCHEIDFGVLPIESSVEGTFFKTLDALSESPLKVVSQVILPVECCLMSQGSLDAIKRVYAEPCMLDLCREWLHAHLPNVEIVPTKSMGQGVEVARGEGDVAAIGSELAARLFEMPIVASNIQSCKENKTRFFVIGRDTQAPSVDVSWKSSLYLTLSNTPGALQKALNAFASRGIDLTKIETRPSRQRVWDYVFYIDLLGHWEDEAVKNAVDELEAAGAFVKCLGSYPRIKAVE